MEWNITTLSRYTKKRKNPNQKSLLQSKKDNSYTCIIFPTDIQCLELATPNNGNVVLSDPALLVGTIATYNCNQGYVLAGDTTRTCNESGDRTIGTWNGTMPQCEGKNNSRGMSSHVPGSFSISKSVWDQARECLNKILVFSHRSSVMWKQIKMLVNA